MKLFLTNSDFTNMEQQIEQSQTPTSKPHYHGPVVRYLFLTTAVMLLVSLPYATKEAGGFSQSVLVMVIAILVIAAGFTSRIQKAGVVVDFVIAMIGFFIAESSALSLYQAENLDTKIFTTYLAVSIMMLFAMYFSIRSIVRLFYTDNDSRTG
ncbi:hypothetical protein IPM19_03725 [bacterium]|nr:MAG: hypothetical protein IPM19_03725 [bacterium]